PKVLHPLGGQPMLSHVIRTAHALQPAQTIVFHGHGASLERERMVDHEVRAGLQADQRGTGHAVAQQLPQIPDDHLVLVLYGDVPLTRPETLRPLLAVAAEGGLALLTVELDDPSGYGRIVRNQSGAVVGIVEHKDASPEQLRIRECNSGLLAAPAALLRGWLGRLRNDNAQGEYYLTDVIAMAVQEGKAVQAIAVSDPMEVAGVNDRCQLAALERELQARQARRLMEAGLTLADLARFDLRGELLHGRDCSIDVNVVLEGRVVLGDRVKIGPNCVIRNAEIGDDVVILPNSVIDDARIGPSCQVGPFARLRPGSELQERARVGNFVEIKAARLQRGSKVNHLSYIGDADVGADVNIGAGTITCNYDGANKHRTVIGDGAFIGSGTNLVAPITVGPGATI